MNIIETNLKFATSMSNRSATNRIIIHHAEATSCTAQQIHQWHLNNGWSGAGYHFLVRKDGKVYRLRPENKIGAHASNHNYDSIGICFEGRYNTESMPAAQLKAGQELVAYIKAKYGITKVQAHRDVNATDCPGKKFPFASVANATASSGTTTSKPSTTTKPSTGTSTTKPSTGSSGTSSSSIGGKYRVNASVLNVRTDPSLKGKVVAKYKKGNTVVLDNWYKNTDGYTWGRYTGATSGQKRYVAIGKATGKPEKNDYLIKL